MVNVFASHRSFVLFETVFVAKLCIITKEEPINLGTNCFVMSELAYYMAEKW